MVFSSISFLFLFLPLFLFAYVMLPWRNACALVFSLLFYAWGDGVYVFLLLGTVLINYLVGVAIARESGPWVLPAGIALNLTILGYFKYTAFLVDDVLGLGHFANGPPHLPLGISFFVFQSITYIVDLHRQQARPARSFFDLALYVSMFPQLIAGPIVRYTTVSEAMRSRRVEWAGVSAGLSTFVTGLSYKVLIADNAAQVADAAFGVELISVDAMTAWLGTVAYALQIYFDFAGYSLMAIGLGGVMGFEFPQNFNYPYVSGSITEFWRRWHISLSTWFRDYLYIPLGGNRKGTVRTYLNLFAVFLLCGLWHGAAWTFVAWGAFHGVLLVVERMGVKRVLSLLPRPVGHGYTLFLVLVGWVLFRSETFHQARAFLEAMLGLGAQAQRQMTELVSHETGIFAVLGVVLSMPAASWLRERCREVLGERASGVLGVATTLALFMLCSIYVLAGTYSPFIYFRF